MTTDASNTDRVEIVDVAPRLIALVRRTVAFADMPNAQREARGLLDAALKAAGIEDSGPRVTVWRPPQGGTIDYAPGVFVTKSFAVSEAVSLFTLPQRRAAHLWMAGGYEGLPGAWERLFGESTAQGLVLTGLNWEVYGTPSDGGADLYALLA